VSTQQVGDAVAKTIGLAQTLQLVKRPQIKVAIVAGTVNASGSGQIFPTGRR
jgi:hypothetical protein